jgi:hypothetical protein
MHMVHAACWTRHLEDAVSSWREYFGAAAGEICHSARRAGLRSCFIELPGGGTPIEIVASS